MSILENFTSSIEPGDRRRVCAIAEAILAAQGFICDEGLLDRAAQGAVDGVGRESARRATAACRLAATIVNYMREELEGEHMDERARTQARLEKLLVDLQQEAGL